MDVRVVCAWCGTVISDPQTDQYPLECPMSHGICPDCYAGQEAVLAGMAPAPAHAGKVGGEG